MSRGDGRNFKVPSDDEAILRWARATRVYKIALDNTETFKNDDIGTTLAYLMGAILNGEKIAADVYAMPLLRVLAPFCPANDPIWVNVDFECHACRREIVGCDNPDVCSDSDQCHVRHVCGAEES